MVASRFSCRSFDVHLYIEEYMKINLHIERCMCSGVVRGF